MTTAICEKEASKILSVAVQTLRNWRHTRRGPAYLKLGRSVRYKIDDLETFMSDRRIDPENQGGTNGKN